MKKNKIKIFALAISMLFVIVFLAACDNKVTITDSTDNQAEKGNDVENTSSTTDGGNEENNNGNVVSATASPEINISYDDASSVVTAVETAVEKVYYSVVSITAITQSATSSGSGVIFAKNDALNISYIVTCFHVIEGAKNLSITYNSADGSKTVPAQLVGGYIDKDIAVLSVEGTNYTYAKFYNDSDSLKLGSTVIAIGNPLGTLPGTVSTGVVSYVNRPIVIDSTTGQKMNLIQTDVAINSGNSGGGLFNSSGNLIGIVNAKYSSSSIEGLSFAIPVNTVVDVVSSINKTAKYDETNKLWSLGYYEGDWELGFTVSTFTVSSGWSLRNVAMVSALSSNQTASGSSVLELREIIQAVAIDYKDEAKTDLVSKSIPNSAEFYTLIYEANLSIGDKIIIVNGNGVTKTVELIQFIYQAN